MITHKSPPSFVGSPSLRKWYYDTPKWKMAEALREYAIMAVGEEDVALEGDYWFHHESGLRWWVGRVGDA